jgi:hypothetical protein
MDTLSFVLFVLSLVRHHTSSLKQSFGEE